MKAFAAPEKEIHCRTGAISEGKAERKDETRIVVYALVLLIEFANSQEKLSDAQTRLSTNLYFHDLGENVSAFNALESPLIISSIRLYFSKEHPRPASGTFGMRNSLLSWNRLARSEHDWICVKPAKVQFPYFFA